MLLAIAAVLGLWAFWLEPSGLTLRPYEIELEDWPEALDGLKVAVISDLHVGSPYKDIGTLPDLVARVNAARPDLILLTGDYLIGDVTGGTYRAPREFAGILGRLTAPMGVYAVLGNHDWWADAPGVVREIGAAGIPVLRNEAAILRIRETNILLFGLDDFRTDHADIRRLRAAVRGGQTTIAFTHHPDIFRYIPDFQGLTIAGHTHGGQVWLPFFGRLIVPSAYGERFAIGHIREDTRDMFVSPGVGTSIIPVRFMVPPEVSIVTLRAPGRSD